VPDTAGVSAPVAVPAPTVSQTVETVPAATTPPVQQVITTLPSAIAPPASAPAGAAAVPGVAAEPANAAATPASGIVMFRTKGPSWVEVTDAKGVVAIRKLIDSGEWVGASGTLPLQVTIGRVDQTEMQLRGKPFDLKPVSKDNVARFEVK